MIRAVLFFLAISAPAFADESQKYLIETLKAQRAELLEWHTQAYAALRAAQDKIAELEAQLKANDDSPPRGKNGGPPPERSE